MVEGVLRHDTEMDVEKQYVNTHGQSEVGFVFSYLLGFSLLPRLKNLKKNGCGIANMKRIENGSFWLTSPLPFLSRRGTPSPLRTCCMFRAAIRPSRQRSTVRYVRSSRADLDICTGCSCQRTWVSLSGHHSFHWLIAFLVSCEVLFTIAAYDRNCDPFWHLCLHLWAGRDGDKGQR
jgi:hypothetical protein